MGSGTSLHSLTISDVEQIFMYQLAACMSSLQNYLFRSFSPALTGFFFYFFAVSFVGSLYILDINPLLIYGLQRFSPFHRLPFHFIVSFAV